jgi:ribosomal RNA-processing protein 36
MPVGHGSSVAASHGAASKIEEIRARKAYSFLDDYQQDELNQLRAAAKKEKDPQAKEKLERAVMSMESRLKAQKRKDRERELLDEHRKKEKELVKQGKQPFYLKKSEQKKKLLLDQFAGMKKGQVDHAIERRRKKVAGKEKKLLPWARRTAEGR